MLHAHGCIAWGPDSIQYGWCEDFVLYVVFLVLIFRNNFSGHSIKYIKGRNFGRMKIWRIWPKSPQLVPAKFNFYKLNSFQI